MASKMGLIQFCILLSLVMAANLAVFRVESRQLQPAEMPKQAEEQNGNDQNGGKMMEEQSRKGKMELGEMKNLPPLPNIPFAPPLPIPQIPFTPQIPGFPIPQIPFTPQIPGFPIPQIPFAPQVPGFPIPQIPFAPPFGIPNAPPFPSIPNFPPLPPFNIPNIPFLTPPPA